MGTSSEDNGYQKPNRTKCTLLTSIYLFVKNAFLIFKIIFILKNFTNLISGRYIHIEYMYIHTSRTTHEASPVYTHNMYKNVINTTIHVMYIPSMYHVCVPHTCMCTHVNVCM